MSTFTNAFIQVVTVRVANQQSLKIGRITGSDNEYYINEGSVYKVATAVGFSLSCIKSLTEKHLKLTPAQLADRLPETVTQQLRKLGVVPCQSTNAYRGARPIPLKALEACLHTPPPSMRAKVPPEFMRVVQEVVAAPVRSPEQEEMHARLEDMQAAHQLMPVVCAKAKSYELPLGPGQYLQGWTTRDHEIIEQELAQVKQHLTATFNHDRGNKMPVEQSTWETLRQTVVMFMKFKKRMFPSLPSTLGALVHGPAMDAWVTFHLLQGNSYGYTAKLIYNIITVLRAAFPPSLCDGTDKEKVDIIIKQYQAVAYQLARHASCAPTKVRVIIRMCMCNYICMHACACVCVVVCV
jgi:hypothetical protein